MADPDLIAEKARRVKDLARQLEEALMDLLAAPNANTIKAEYEVAHYDVIGQSFPVPRIQVKLQEIKNL